MTLTLRSEAASTSTASACASSSARAGVTTGVRPAGNMNGSSWESGRVRSASHCTRCTASRVLWM
ncbi:Uncharacterised protein [Bordetella pertussis]|nr:hypothetical protein [Bordetella pertussis]UEB58796.1 hypothetical protein LK428_03005 [Bordetella pertussis]CFL84901.1 Uncharacterised protein [Bordetella pertussis]CFM07321.1 Uncharacterised protein [Bordetella pertussis]CFM38000.1 Uncharacterised protein [Bordetella pertussis]CFM76723.1 Uncharacterised protein [Bordetella pertussis]